MKSLIGISCWCWCWLSGVAFGGDQIRAVMGMWQTSPQTEIEYQSYSAAHVIDTVAENTLTISKPSGVVAGDTMVAVFFSARVVSLGGWAEIENTGTIRVLSKTAEAGEPSDYTFALAATYSQCHGVIVRVSGPVFSVTARGEVFNAVYDADINFPTINVAANGTLLIWVGMLSQTAADGNIPVSSVSRGIVKYQGYNFPEAYTGYIATEENVASDSGITNMFILAGGMNNKTGDVIVVSP